MNEPSTKKRPSEPKRPTRGRADLERLRRMTEADIRRTAPPELADLPADFWDDGELVVPAPKQAISLRVDREVLDWFKQTGPRYQTRMNGVLRSYMARTRKPAAAPDRKRHRRKSA
ncbi:MAG: BrnA antitoxin family protein [Acidobacteriota bacterium]